MSNTKKFLLGILGTVFIIFTVGYTFNFGGFRADVNMFFSKRDQVDKATSTESAIQEYEFFIDANERYNKIKSDITLYEDDLENCETDCKYIEDSLRGKKIALNDLVSEYNSKSDMYTRNQFKNENLPYKLEYYE